MKTANPIHHTSPSITITSFRQVTLITVYLVIGYGLFNFSAVANQVLLFHDAEFFFGVPSRYQTALDNRGYPYTVFTDASGFNQAVQAADPASDVIVIDALANAYNFSSVSAFVQAGGRALLQYWNLAGDVNLATTFEVSVAQQLSWPASIYDWGGASELYNGIGTPLATFPVDVGVHGQRLQSNAGGQAVSGFVASPSANQAALVIGNSGRTIVQGFNIEEIELFEEALQFAQNELDFLFGPIAPASGPWIIADPKLQTILAGFGTTLRVQAGGSLPLNYQWQKDGTNILGATNAFYPITNAQLDQTGSYSVVVSNANYAAPSGASLLTVTDPAPIASVLLMVDDGTFPSPYEDSLIALGLAYQKYSEPDPFNTAVTLADPVNTLVILDAYASIWRYSELVAFVRAGGRAIMQNWDLTNSTRLAEIFDVSAVQPNKIILPIYNWGGSGFFDGVTTPLALGPLSPSPSIHGQKLEPLTGGQAIAGFVASPTTNEAAIIIGNSGHTIVNGFMLEEAVSSAEAAQVARNQILHFNPTLPPPPVVVFSDDFEAGMANWTVTLGATVLDWSVNQNQAPAGGGHSALLNSSLDKMYHNLGIELSGWSKATFYIYDDTATRAYGEVRSYVEAGYNPSATLQNLYAIGKYNAVTMAGEIFDGTKYQGRIAIGPGPNGWFNLNAPGAPGRSPGWHRFDIERLSDGVTYNFYVDGTLGRSFTGVTDFPWDTATIGSVAAGSSAGDAYFDGVEIVTRFETGLPSIPLNIELIPNAVILTWSNATFSLQSAPTVDAGFTNVPGATSPYTNAITGPQQFFRLMGN